MSCDTTSIEAKSGVWCLRCELAYQADEFRNRGSLFHALFHAGIEERPARRPHSEACCSLGAVP